MPLGSPPHLESPAKITRKSSPSPNLDVHQSLRTIAMVQLMLLPWYTIVIRLCMIRHPCGSELVVRRFFGEAGGPASRHVHEHMLRVCVASRHVRACAARASCRKDSVWEKGRAVTPPTSPRPHQITLDKIWQLYSAAQTLLCTTVRYTTAPCDTLAVQYSTVQSIRLKMYLKCFPPPRQHTRWAITLVASFHLLVPGCSSNHGFRFFLSLVCHVLLVCLFPNCFPVSITLHTPRSELPWDAIQEVIHSTWPRTTFQKQ